MLRTVIAFSLLLGALAAQAADTVPAVVQQPGTQPQEVGNLESPDKCDNCHGGYNSAVEPAHNWRGGMMAHAGRDPVFWATLAIAEQDFDGSGDLCLRCHAPAGWLAGRSTPTDGSGLAAGDSDGVECDLCHKLTNPDDSDPILQGIMNAPYIANDGVEGFYGSGMTLIWGGSDKLGPYADAEPKHQFMMSSFHRSVDFCGTCHDVSNPVVGNLAHNVGSQSGTGVVADGLIDGPVDGKAAFNNPPYRYGVVERTFSEYKAGKVSQTLVKNFPSLPQDLQAGALAAIYQAATANGGDGNYADGTPRYYSCQSCHMRPVTGYGANKRGIPLRNDLPLHDLTGGNYWAPQAINWLDQHNKLRLGGGMSTEQVNAMLDGAERAKEQLRLAATLSVNGNKVKVINHTGHKLISGYPEGRRMWLNIKWYDADGQQLPREDGKYGDLTVALDGNPITVRTLLDLDGSNTRIYQADYGITKAWAGQLLALGYDPNTPVEYDRKTAKVSERLGNVANGSDATHHSFHFVLNNTVVADNRIPPYGMSFNEAEARNALPVPADQYGGGTAGSTYRYWDELTLAPPSPASYATIDLLYQPTSWEYIQFLYLSSNGQNAFLGEEAKNLLDAWLATGMAEPYVMASTTWGSPPTTGCSLSAPTLLSAVPTANEIQLNWQDNTHGAADGFTLYYDQAGKAQKIVQQPCDGASSCTAYLDIGLNTDQQYCYKVTAYSSSCESAFSNLLCATTTTAGLADAGVASPLTTGKWLVEGQGKNATQAFVTVSYPDAFTAGDEVVIQGTVKDKDGTPLAGATVAVRVLASGGTSVAALTSTTSDSLGNFEATWSTSAPNKKGTGGTAAGDYRAEVTDVQVSGYSWDSVATWADIRIQ